MVNDTHRRSTRKRVVVNLRDVVGRSKHIKVKSQLNVGKLIGTVELHVLHKVEGSHESNLLSAPPSKDDAVLGLETRAVPLKDDLEERGATRTVIVDTRSLRNGIQADHGKDREPKG
jgi:hypothetical protein